MNTAASLADMHSVPAHAPDDDALRHLLAHSRTIAVVGISARPDRPSHEVAHYLQSQGYCIVPVNPVIAAQGQPVLGQVCYASLTHAAAVLGEQGVRIDIVDCFRKSEDIPPLAQEAIAIGAGCLWMQLDIFNEAAAAQARAAGLVVVQNRCPKIEHRRLMPAAR